MLLKFGQTKIEFVFIVIYSLLVLSSIEVSGGGGFLIAKDFACNLENLQIL